MHEELDPSKDNLEIQHMLLMNPMNFKSQEEFKQMVIEIESNKLAEVQLNKINQIHKLNAINDQKFMKKTEE